jgi:hypothetical protein
VKYFDALRLTSAPIVRLALLAASMLQYASTVAYEKYGANPVSIARSKQASRSVFRSPAKPFKK